MKLGTRGEVLIKSFETLRLTGYLPTPNDKPTAGWGHVGPTVLPNITNRIAPFMKTDCIVIAVQVIQGANTRG